jgi:hypothetical protein
MVTIDRARAKPDSTVAAPTNQTALLLVKIIFVLLILLLLPKLVF